jgi:DNA mismatch endonuclease Vsr
MVDIFSPQKRSDIMSHITGKNTSPELAIRQLLWAAGYRYRVNTRVEGCKPDLVLHSCRLVIFVDGCFWHGCPNHYSLPMGNIEFWRVKLATNTTRDRRQTDALLTAGWKVLRFWECLIERDPGKVLDRIVSAIKSKRLMKPSHWRAISMQISHKGRTTLLLERIDGSESKMLTWSGKNRVYIAGQHGLPKLRKSKMRSVRAMK